MKTEQKILESWAPDYTNDEGEEFYEKGKVAIILSEYRQIVLKNPSSNNRYSITLRQIAEIKDAGESMRAMLGNGEDSAEDCFGRHVKWINAILKRNGFKQIE